MRRTVIIALLSAALVGLVLAFGTESSVKQCGDNYSTYIKIFGIELPALSTNPFVRFCAGGSKTTYRGFVSVGSECIGCPTLLDEVDTSTSEDTLTILWVNMLIPLFATVLGLKIWQLIIASKGLKKQLQPK